MMTENEILEVLDKIVAKETDAKEVSLTLTTQAPEVKGWDSLTHMMIVNSVEKHFAIKFKLTEIMKFKNVGDMVSCIIAKKIA